MTRAQSIRWRNLDQYAFGRIFIKRRLHLPKDTGDFTIFSKKVLIGECFWVNQIDTSHGKYTVS